MRHLDAILALMSEEIRDSDFRRDCQRHMEQAETRGLHLQITIGPGLCSDGKARLVYCLGEELHIHDLTDNQVRRAGLGRGQMNCRLTRPPWELAPAGKQAVILHSLEIERADGLAVGSPMMVHFSYTWNSEQAGPCVLRLDYNIDHRSSTTSWNHVDRLAGLRGRIVCGFPPFRGKASSNAPPSGLCTVFLRVCSMPSPTEKSNRQPISNVCSAVVAIEPGNLRVGGVRQ